MAVAALLLAGCGRGASSSTSSAKPVSLTNPPEIAGAAASGGTVDQPPRPGVPKPAVLEVHSSAFRDGAAIPKKYTADGADVSAPLNWSKVPALTKSLALIVDDPDAAGPSHWVHWVLYDLDPAVTALPENLPRKATLSEPVAARQGKNSWKTIGYRGPNPPPGKVHHYHFRLYALDAQLDVPAGATARQVLVAMRHHVIAQGDLVGTYQRR